MPQLISFEALKSRKKSVDIIKVSPLGDIIACQPVISFLKDTYTEYQITWIVLAQYADLLKCHPKLDFICIAESLSEAVKWLYELPNDHIKLYFHFQGDRCQLSNEVVYTNEDLEVTYENYHDFGGLLEIFSKAAGLPVLSGPPEFHITPSAVSPLADLDLPKYVVIHCQSSDSGRDWDPAKWALLVKFFADQKIHVVEIGQERVVETDSSYYIDMTHEHDYHKVALIIKDAYFYFGIDSGWAHVANAFKINGLVIMGQFHRWNNHNPFNGYYRRGHIIRVYGLPSYFTPLETVINAYKKMVSPLGAASESDGTEEYCAREELDSAVKPCIMQNIIVLFSRLYVKYRYSRSEYNYLKKYKILFYSRPECRRLSFRLIKCILGLFGKYPPAAKVIRM